MEFQFYKMKRIMGMDGGDSCTAMSMYFMSLNCTLRSSEDGKFYVMCVLPQ